jgi:hypothetical protein
MGKFISTLTTNFLSKKQEPKYTLAANADLHHCYSADDMLRLLVTKGIIIEIKDCNGKVD